MADLFDNIAAWLLDQALGDDAVVNIVQALATRLVEGGVPVARLSTGRSILHPTIGLIDMQWEGETGQVNVQNIPRSAVRSDLT